MSHLLKLSAAVAVIAVALLSCAAPGVETSPQPGDFAFVQVDLRG